METAEPTSIDLRSRVEGVDDARVRRFILPSQRIYEAALTEAEAAYLQVQLEAFAAQSRAAAVYPSGLNSTLDMPELVRIGIAAYEDALLLERDVDAADRTLRAVMACELQRQAAILEGRR